MLRRSGRLSFFLAATLSLLPACSDQGDPLSQESICALADSRLSFGDVLVGESADRSFVIRNVGTVEFSGQLSPPGSDFSIVAGGGSYTLAAGDSLEVIVRFSPSSAGLATGSINTGPECGDVSLSGEGVTVQTVISYADDIQPIFTGNCALSGCHVVPTLSGSLDLSSGASYANLVGVESSGYAPALRVGPGDPAASVLYNKVAGTGRFGAQMPPRSSLTSGEIEAIRSWIADDAPEN